MESSSKLADACGIKLYKLKEKLINKLLITLPFKWSYIIDFKMNYIAVCYIESIQSVKYRENEEQYIVAMCWAKYSRMDQVKFVKDSH